jgi:hypothetical protein
MTQVAESIEALSTPSSPRPAVLAPQPTAPVAIVEARQLPLAATDPVPPVTAAPAIMTLALMPSRAIAPRLLTPSPRPTPTPMPQPAITYTVPGVAEPEVSVPPPYRAPATQPSRGHRSRPAMMPSTAIHIEARESVFATRLPLLQQSGEQMFTGGSGAA